MIKKYKLFLENKHQDIINDINDMLTELTDEGIYCKAYPDGDDHKIYFEISKNIDNEDVLDLDLPLDKCSFSGKEFKMIIEVLKSINKYTQFYGYSLSVIECEYIEEGQNDTSVHDYKNIEDILLKIDKGGIFDIQYKYFLYYIDVTLCEINI